MNRAAPLSAVKAPNLAPEEERAEIDGNHRTS